MGKEGHYYHQHVILPKLLKLLDLKSGSSLLDLGCGQGVLARAIPAHISYCGVDLSSSLIKQAKERASSHQKFVVGDITEPLPLKGEFSHAVVLLALQNVEHPDKVLLEAEKHLTQDGTLVLVLNHPCFRIPRQSHWGIDEAKKIQYRRIDRYLSPLKIPIQTHPGKGAESSQSWSFHHSLSHFTSLLYRAGFWIECMDEWTSDKESTGKNAKMENRAREEFPLFLAIKARKKSL